MSDSFQHQCRLLRRATVFVLLGLAVLVLPGLAGTPLWPAAMAEANDSQRFWVHVVHLLPAIGYFWALWSVQLALGRLAAGHTFQPTVARAMRHMGAGVLTGALLQVFAVSNLLRVLLDTRGGYLYFELSAIVLGVVGAALLMFAQLIDRAGLLQAELDEIV